MFYKCVKLRRFCGTIPLEPINTDGIGARIGILTDVTDIQQVDQIQKNLEPLINNNKKQVAQALYYANHPEHQSPLTRQDKGPVHARLGMKAARRRLMPLGTNTTNVLPKRKYLQVNRHRNNNGLGIQNRRQFKRTNRPRLFSAQNRLERIRSQQAGRPGPVKLRRINRITPTNLTVQVQNTNFKSNNITNPNPEVYRFKMDLDLQVQDAIAEIQQECKESMGPLPINTRIIPVTTNVTTSYRFGLL